MGAARRAIHGGEALRSVVHRVAIFDKQGNITHIVSQSDVIRCTPRCAASHVLQMSNAAHG